jgi:hypothetical protein
MGPRESLSKDLSNNYQYYRVSIASKNVHNFLFSDFGDRSKSQSLTLWTLAIFTNFENLLKFPLWVVSQSETILFRKNRI